MIAVEEKCLIIVMWYMCVLWCCVAYAFDWHWFNPLNNRLIWWWILEYFNVCYHRFDTCALCISIWHSILNRRWANFHVMMTITLITIITQSMFNFRRVFEWHFVEFKKFCIFQKIQKCTDDEKPSHVQHFIEFDYLLVKRIAWKSIYLKPQTTLKHWTCE